jgi:hypothetical protein
MVPNAAKTHTILLMVTHYERVLTQSPSTTESTAQAVTHLVTAYLNERRPDIERKIQTLMADRHHDGMVTLCQLS